MEYSDSTGAGNTDSTVAGGGDEQRIWCVALVAAFVAVGCVGGSLSRALKL